VVGPNGQCVPAARRRGATARMRDQLNLEPNNPTLNPGGLSIGDSPVGSDRQRMPSAANTAGRLASGIGVIPTGF
jgi:hypothetical protein